MRPQATLETSHRAAEPVAYTFLPYNTYTLTHPRGFQSYPPALLTEARKWLL